MNLIPSHGTFTVCFLLLFLISLLSVLILWHPVGTYPFFVLFVRVFPDSIKKKKIRVKIEYFYINTRSL